MKIKKLSLLVVEEIVGVGIHGDPKRPLIHLVDPESGKTLATADLHDEKDGEDNSLIWRIAAVAKEASS